MLVVMNLFQMENQRVEAPVTFNTVLAIPSKKYGFMGRSVTSFAFLSVPPNNGVTSSLSTCTCKVGVTGTSYAQVPSDQSMKSV